MDDETGSGDRPGSARWGATLWAGGGVLVAGLGVLGYALVGTEGVYPTVGNGDGRRYESWLVLALGSGCAVVTVAVVGLVLAVARRGAGGRLTAYPRPEFGPGVAVLLVLLGPAIWAYTASVDDMPFPGERALLATGAFGFVLVGAVVVYAVSRWLSSVAAPRPWSRRCGVAVIAGVTAVGLATATVVAVAGEPARVDAATAEAVPAPPVPDDPARVLWRWSGSSSLGVVAAGAGVVIATSDSVVGLDGRTGQERWHYRRTDTAFRGHIFEQHLAAVDGGRIVIASFEGRLHALDAFTGELLWRDEGTTAQTPPPWGRAIVATGSTVIRYRDSPTWDFAGTDVRTGRLTWRYASEHPECIPTADAVGETMIIEYLCDRSSEEEETVGVDGATGERLWRIPGDVYVKHRLALNMDEDEGLRDPRTGRELVPSGSPLAFDSGEIIRPTGSLFEVGAAAPRWEVPDTAPPAKFDDGAAVAASFLDGAVVLANDRSCPGGRTGLQLRVVDRADGTERRSFDCAEIPVDGYADDVELISAPGAVVVRGTTSLVAVG